MAEKFSALLTMAIFVSLFISIKSQRSSKEVDELVDLLEEQGRSRELAIIKDYQLSTIDEAIETLEKLKAGTAKFLLILSSQLPRH